MHKRRLAGPRRSHNGQELGTLDVQVDGDGDDVLDLLRDGADDLGLALHAMTTRRTSLDELFVDEPR